MRFSLPRQTSPASQPSSLRWWLLTTGLLAAAVWGVAVWLSEGRARAEEARLEATRGAVQRVEVSLKKRFAYGSGVLSLYGNVSRGHTLATLVYGLRPPIGGAHRPAWQNCGAYRQALDDALAVHSLEHGAVWITYRSGLSEPDRAKLEALAADSGRVLVSPYPAQQSPVVASSWGLQLRLPQLDLATLRRFVAEYQGSGPEPGAPCLGGLGTPSSSVR